MASEKPKWWPRDLTNYQEKVKPPPWDDNTFMVIPNKMLELSMGLPEKITISDIWALTYITRKASKSPGCQLSLKQINNAMGPSTGKGERPELRTRARIRKFERCGLVQVERPNKSGRGASFTVCQELIDIIEQANHKEEKSIRIGPEIFLLNLPLPTKTALAIKKALPSIKATHLSKKLRITFQQAQNHLNFILSNDWTIQFGTPIKTLMDPYQNLNKVLVLGLVLGLALMF